MAKRKNTLNRNWLMTQRTDWLNELAPQVMKVLRETLKLRKRASQLERKPIAGRYVQFGNQLAEATAFAVSRFQRVEDVEALVYVLALLRRAARDQETSLRASAERQERQKAQQSLPAEPPEYKQRRGRKIDLD